MRVAKELVTINELIQHMESKGMEFYLEHSILENPLDWGDDPSMPIQAMTTFNGFDDVLDVTFTGYAYCSSKDHFSKAVGAQIAFGRFMESWSDYAGRNYVKEVMA